MMNLFPSSWLHNETVNAREFLTKLDTTKLLGPGIDPERFAKAMLHDLANAVNPSSVLNSGQVAFVENQLKRIFTTTFNELTKIGRDVALDTRDTHFLTLATYINSCSGK